ncbi:hypothetical protein [Pseudomonas sp. Pseusp97]|uniref:hypothetical protein n=1 Tax=Pseudomonas sp. Pseusp97 TaxID=3243065 RepID=UPI0039A5AD74
MKPDGLLNEYMSSLVSGIRFVFLMIISGLIAGKLERFFEFKNPIEFILILFPVYFALEGLLSLFKRRGKKKVKEIQRGGYD